MVGYEILLREHDFPDPDDTLATTTSASQGFFSVSGHHSELFAIEPYIRVKHNCAVKDPQKCYRLSDYYVPKDAVEQGYYNYGEIPLRAEATTDELHCE
ncbi:transthyretin-like protein 2 precursor [Aphelenchoides avenae]|nr:transthyretin-like protein 2 precursor [Aphelenchus avenae]